MPALTPDKAVIRFCKLRIKNCQRLQKDPCSLNALVQAIVPHPPGLCFLLSPWNDGQHPGACAAWRSTIVLKPSTAGWKPEFRRRKHRHV